MLGFEVYHAWPPRNPAIQLWYRPDWGEKVTPAQRTGISGPPHSVGRHLPEVQFQLQFHAQTLVNLTADQLD